MIESVSTLSVQGSSLKHTSQAVNALVVAQEQASSSANLPSWRIRVDNALDRAIIEVRSSESGKVLRQYPTEAQLRAFARAQELDNARKTQNAAELSDASDDSAPAPQTQEAPSPAPAPAQSQPSSQISAALASSGTPKQSVVV